MLTNPFDLWVYLSTSPLLWLSITLTVWVFSDRLSQFSQHNPLFNPVLISVIVIGCILGFTGTTYRVYFEGAQFIHFLLGPATVAIAIPIVKNWPTVRLNLLPLFVALFVGCFTAIASAIGLGLMLGLPETVLLALAPKSVTAGVAMALAQQQGGDPALAAVIVLITGITGAVTITPLMAILRVKDQAAQGFAVGLAAHGIGMARAFVVSPLAGIFAGIAMAANAVLTAFVIPLLL